MACKSCTESSYRTAFYGPYPACNQQIACTGDCPNGVIDAACVAYTGPQLVNLGLNTNICLETILQKIDEQLAATTGNYAGYNVACLAPVVTQKQFVEKISQFVCNTQDQLNDFINNTFVNEISNLQTQIDGFLNPNITSCAKVGIVATDTNTEVLQKLANRECDLYSLLDTSTANWNQCFTIVGAAPATPVQAVNALIAQICSIKDAQGTSNLPIFNNTNTCLSGGTATDTLVQTINLMKTRLCQTPILNINNLTFGCISKPSQDALDLQGTLQSILSKLDTMSKNFPNFNTTQFTIGAVDPSNQCLGKTISLNSSTGNSDRLVAATATDTNPGTLIDKLAAGYGIVLDFTTNPGQATIGVSPSLQTADEKVKAVAGDPTSGYLNDKMDAQGIAPLSLSTAVVANKVRVTGSIDIEALATQLLTAIQEDDTLRALFCTIVNSCPSTCAAPINASVSFQTT